MPITIAPALPVTEEQWSELNRMASSTALPHRKVVQARALLLAADGVSNEEIARRSGVDSDAVRRWRSRFVERGIAGVGAIAKGRACGLPHGMVAEVVRITCQEKPGDGRFGVTAHTRSSP